MSSTNKPPLSAADLEEIAEYDKIVKLRDDIVAGIHPRIPCPSWCPIGGPVPRNSNATTPLPAFKPYVATRPPTRGGNFYQKSDADTDAAQAARNTSVAQTVLASAPSILVVAPETSFFAEHAHHDYYKDLGVGRNATLSNICRAFKERMLLYSPQSEAASHKWSSEKDSIRRRVEKKYSMIKRAFGVLSNAKRQAEYDEAHDVYVAQRRAKDDVPLTWAEEAAKAAADMKSKAKV